MAHLVYDRVKQVTTTTGTGTYTLGAAVSGFRTIGSVLSTSDTTFYAVTGAPGSGITAWEVGLGTLDGSGNLVRTTILASSTGSAISWTAGTKHIGIVDPAARSFWNLGAGLLKGNAQGQLTAVSTSAFGEAFINCADRVAARSDLGLTTTDLSTFSDPLTTDTILAFDGSTLKLIEMGNYLNIIGALTTYASTVNGANDRLFLFEPGVGMQQIAPNVLISGKQTIWIPAGATWSRSTNGAGDGTTQTSTNLVNLKTKDFDPSTKEHIQFIVVFPKSYNLGTVSFRAMWTALTGTASIALALAARAFADGDAIDQAVGTSVIVTDALVTANTFRVTTESSAITIDGGPGDFDIVLFNLSREVADGSDTLGADMKLIGIHLYFTTDQKDDT